MLKKSFKNDGMRLRETIRSVMRLLCLMKIFCEVILASEEAGDLLTAALMDPLMLTHKATHQVIETKSPLKEQSSKLIRPGTPGPLVINRLSPMVVKTMKQKKKRDRADVLLRNPTIPQRLEPIRKSSWGSTSSSSGGSPIGTEDFFEEIEAAIKVSHLEAVSYLSTRQEMRKLKVEDLLELLTLSYERYVLKYSREIFPQLFTEIVDKIVPKYHPSSLKEFTSFALNKSVPKRLFSIAVKHVRLLSKADLSEFIREIETKYIWEKIDQLGMGHVKTFALVIDEIAANLDRTEDFVETDYVKEVISIDEEKSKIGQKFSKTLNQVQFVYMTIYLLGGLKSLDPSSDDESLRKPLNQLFDIARNELSIETERILELLEPMTKFYLPLVTEEQVEPMGRFMKILHETIKAQNDLPYIPTRMREVEDIYIYIQSNLINLAQARLKYYRSSRLTKGQVLALLNTAEIADAVDPRLILLILGTVNIDPINISEKDLKFLNYRPRVLMKGFLTFPARFDGDICIPNPLLKQTQNVIWDLPDDLFLSKDGHFYDKGSFIMTETLMNLPRLFLYRVFGLPMNFAEVDVGMDELPEKRELIDVANFFLERWCSIKNPGSYPIVRVRSNDKI